VHEYRTGDEGNLSARALHIRHHRRNTSDGHFHTPLRRDLVRHEREAETIALLKLRDGSHALHSTYDLVAGPHVAQFAADGTAVFDHDDRIHPLALDFQPAAAVPHERLEVRRGVEIIRHAAVPIGGAEQRIGRPRDLASERDELFEDPFQAFFGRRGDPHRNRRRLVVGPADRELQHLERRVPFDDSVEDHVQQLRVDQMAFGFDHLAVHGGVFNHVVNAGWAAPAAARHGNRAPRYRSGRG
jgi:hypothetical protein